ncbi:blast:Transcription initiation factor TFIID subunit 5 [Drosophila guanche]|uniref:Blast:Transcription initiation factor TFIID subunit 5 n=2 Tax=Drosophila guanche TaxID=7266 RepID=A0A3B0J9M6_DROGU|nr:blast:Transcription initiation factor TFIID subunit 5 [Drosophila guanche]
MPQNPIHQRKGIIPIRVFASDSSSSASDADSSSGGSRSGSSSDEDESPNEEAIVIEDSSEGSSEVSSEMSSEMSSPVYEYNSGPLPSMPLYDEETNEFKPPTDQHIREMSETIAETDFKQPKCSVKYEEPEPVTDYDEDSDGFSSGDDSEISDEAESAQMIHPLSKRKAAWLKFTLGTGEVPFRYVKESPGSFCDYSVEAEATAATGSEFYEDGVSDGQDPKETHIFQVINQAEIFEQYEQTFRAVLSMVEESCSHFRFDLHQLLYPLLTLTYLQMVASDNANGGWSFLRHCCRCLDDASYKSRLETLAKILRPEDVPAKARLLLNGHEKVKIFMSRGAYRQCVLQLARLPYWQQDKVLGHFIIRSYDEAKLPLQRLRLGNPPLKAMVWTAPGMHEERAAAAGRHRKRDFAGHFSVPFRQQLYTPPPSLKDEIKRRTHDQQRETLDRERLPSVYLYTATAGEERILCADFSVNYEMLALGTSTSLLQVFSVDNSKLLEDMTLSTGSTGSTDKRHKRTLCGHRKAVYGCSFGPDDRYLLSCSLDSDVRLWCLRSWRCLVIYTCHLAAVHCVVFDPLGFYFATASADGTARVWAQSVKKPARLFSGHLASVEVCQFHPNRYYLATGSADCTVRIWEIVSGRQVRLLSGHKARVQSLAFSKCGRFLASGGADNLLILWDMPRERMMRCLRHHTAVIDSCDFDMNNNLLVVSSRDGRLSVWDFDRLLQDSAGRGSALPQLPLKSYDNHEGAICKVSFTNANLLMGVRLAHKSHRKCQY